MAELDDFVVAEDVLSLSQIDKLIKDTNYEKALTELNKYIERYPENFDNAQIRIGRIMTARNRYSQLAEELIRVVTEEPENDEKIYSITYQLEHLERYPTDQQLAFIKDIYVAAEFNHFRKEFQRINDETDALIEKGSYVEAANKAFEGFDLYQERFYEDVNDLDILVKVNKSLDDVEEILYDYEKVQENYTNSVAAFLSAVDKENRPEIDRTLALVQQEFKSVALLRNKIYGAGETFNEMFELLKERTGSDLTDASFLPFVSRFTLGRQDTEYSGIAGAMDRQWDENLERMMNAVDGKLFKYVGQFQKSLPENIMESTLASVNTAVMTDIKDFSNLAVSVSGLNSVLTPDLKENRNRMYKTTGEYAYNLPQKILGLYEMQEDLLERTNKALAMQVPENPSEAELKNVSFVNDFIVALKNINYSSTNKLDMALSLIQVNQNDILESLERTYYAYTDELFAYVADSETKANQILCDYIRNSDDGFVLQSQDAHKVASTNFQGIEIETGIVRKYPELSYTQANELSRTIDSQIAVIRRHMERLPEVTNWSLQEETSQILEEDIIKLRALKGLAGDLAEVSRNSIQSASKARNEAELRLRQAEIALESDNFETARKRLQESRTRFNDALAISFSDELLNESDETLQHLGERINQKENEIVVSDVRKLKTQAKNEYYAGNFEAAENLLTQASSRWSVTNVEDDQEISSLRALVNSALSMKTGRVILPSAPLYPEMSQILSVASQYYTEGENLINIGDRAGGVAMLQSALKKIQEVQLVYPLNQEASLLSLRIQKVLSPTEFDSMFTRKVTEAKSNYKVAAKQQESYADLLDLYEINPKYPGLKDLIYNVELEIGIRKKPVTKVVSNKSQDLTKEAQNIYNKANGDEDKLKNALAKLDEAIVLNPENTQAIALKDKIQVNIGGNASAVLSSEDEQRYQLAIQELQSKNIITANAIVEQLLQKQSNKKSTKILELQKKIKALL